MVLQFVRLTSNLDKDELLNRAIDRKSQFEEMPGLIQKYYVQISESNTYGGIYIWDSVDSMKAFSESDLAKSIPSAYEVSSPPSIEMMDILFQLKD